MENKDFFDKLKQAIISVDPIAWAEANIILDGNKLDFRKNGYKPFTDVYRTIGIKLLDRNHSKPVILVKGRQVGCTTMAAILELFFCCSGLFGNKQNPPFRIIHAFPQLDLAYTFTKTKLNPLISQAEPASEYIPGKKQKTKIEAKLDNSASASDSLQWKQFLGGNFINIDSLGLQADRIRGRTVDCIFFDEIQDMRGAAISNALKVLTKSQYGQINKGVQVYFGTPKQAGSDYWRLWQKSNQQYYHLRCEECLDFFPLYVPGGDEWEKIWIEDDLPYDHPNHGFIVKCTHCGFEQDKRKAAENGKWIGKNEDCEFIGYHMNQLYIPTFKRKDIINEKPENHPINTEKLYRNEVLGEFTSGDSSIITMEHLDTFCSDRDRRMVKRLTPSDDRKVYLGCDWGKKVELDEVGENSRKHQGQSYSCVVVLQAEGKNLTVEYAERLKKNDISYKKEFIDELYRRFNINIGIGDIGYANDLTELLQRQHGDKFLASQASERVNKKVKLNLEVFPKTIIFERDYHIAELYSILRDGKIKFPYGSIEEVSWLLTHITSMQIKPSQDRYGQIKTRYVKGSTPNDGFMALLNAYLAYKFDITNGFVIQNPNNFIDPVKKEEIPAIGANCPYFSHSKRIKF